MMVDRRTTALDWTGLVPLALLEQDTQAEYLDYIEFTPRDRPATTPGVSTLTGMKIQMAS
jgi:hypothetical protein